MSKSLPVGRVGRVRSHRLRAVRLSIAAVVLCTAALAPLPAIAATFNPLLIISDENWRAGDSMSQAEVQAFLETQAGVLKTYACAEGGPNGLHSTVVKPASQIIAEAASYWNVNPKLIIATLQKEQSLITQPWHTGKDIDPTSTHLHSTVYHLTRAMGCGVYPGSADTHPGFGDQVWTGAGKLGAAPPAGSTSAYAWYPGKKKTVKLLSSTETTVIVPLNQPTWNLYTYTPYYPQSSVWNQYVKFFEDPLADPALRPVYRFYNLKTGTHFYTASELEKYRVKSKMATTYRYEGVAYRVNSLNPDNVTPLSRFFNTKTGVHFYSANASETANVKENLASVYTYEGVAYKVSSNPVGGTPVYRFYNMKKGVHFYTASETEKKNVIDTLPTYRYEGVGYYIAP